MIDEISVVGSRLLSRLDTRLRQTEGINEPFGGLSVLVVGDLYQLLPVIWILWTEKSNETEWIGVHSCFE